VFEPDVDLFRRQQVPTHFGYWCVVDDVAVVHHDRPIRNVFDVGHIMARQEHGGAQFGIELYQ